MKLIITAGGTSEKIDEVRKITNMATGRLGSLIASEFAAQGGGRVGKIYYVCERGAVTPQLPCVEVVYTSGVSGLQTALKALFERHRIDAVIHSMAVSDYAVASVTTAAAVAGAAGRLAMEADGLCRDRLERYISDALLAENSLGGAQKIPSDVESPILVLRRTPKIIGMFKALQPDTLLVGFKLLSGVTEEALLRAGRGIMQKNGCDFVLANDAESLRGGGQIGYLLSPGGGGERLDGKPAIACRIAQVVLDKLAQAQEPERTGI